MRDLIRQLVLLLAGAALTLGTATLVTRGWQNHDNEVSARNAVARELGQSVGSFLGAVRVHGGATTRVRELDDAFAEWDAASRAIGGELRAYFPDSGLARRWRNYRTTMTGVYAVFRAPRRATRTFWLRRVNDYLAPPGSSEDNYQNLNGLLELPPGGATIGSVYDNARRVLLFQLTARAERFVEDLVEAESIYD